MFDAVLSFSVDVACVNASAEREDRPHTSDYKKHEE